MTSFPDMTRTDYIGSVDHILAPEDEDFITMDEHQDSSIVGEQMAGIESQSIPSSTNLKEMQQVVRLGKTNDVKQIKGWKNKFSHCVGISAPNVSKSPSGTVVSDSSDFPGTLMDDDEEDFSIQGEFQEIENQVTSREEQVNPGNIISAANSTVLSLERTRQIKLEIMLRKESKVETNVPNTSKANVDETELDNLGNSEYQDQYQKEYGTLFQIFFFFFAILFDNHL